MNNMETTAHQIVVVPASNGRVVPKSNRVSRILVCIEMVLSCVILIFGLATASISYSQNNYMEVQYREESEVNDLLRGTDYYHYGNCCFGGTGLWGPIFLVVTSAIGMCGIFRSKYRCPRVAFLVLVIIASMVSAVICIMHGIYAGIVDQNDYWIHEEDLEYLSGRGRYNAYKTMLVLICVLALINMICCICSASFWCYNWCKCCNGNSSTKQGAVVYDGSRGQQQTIMIPVDALQQARLSGQNVIIVSGGTNETHSAVGVQQVAAGLEAPGVPDGSSQTSSPPSYHDIEKESFKYGKLGH